VTNDRNMRTIAVRKPERWVFEVFGPFLANEMGIGYLYILFALDIRLFIHVFSIVMGYEAIVSDIRIDAIRAISNSSSYILLRTIVPKGHN